MLNDSVSNIQNATQQTQYEYALINSMRVI